MVLLPLFIMIFTQEAQIPGILETTKEDFTHDDYYESLIYYNIIIF